MLSRMASGQKVAMSTFCISISFFEGRVCITHRCLQANMVTDTRYTKAQSAFIVVKHCFIQCPPTSPFSRATNPRRHTTGCRSFAFGLDMCSWSWNRSRAVYSFYRTYITQDRLPIASMLWNSQKHMISLTMARRFGSSKVLPIFPLQLSYLSTERRSLYSTSHCTV